jgi:starch synthase
MKRARGLFNHRKLWTKLMKRAMARNFSWDASAKHYEALYRELPGTDNQVAT